MNKNKHIHVRISEKQKSRFDKSLKIDGRKSGEIIRQWILKYCNSVERKKT